MRLPRVSALPVRIRPNTSGIRRLSASQHLSRQSTLAARQSTSLVVVPKLSNHPLAHIQDHVATVGDFLRHAIKILKVDSFEKLAMLDNGFYPSGFCLESTTGYKLPFPIIVNDGLVFELREDKEIKKGGCGTVFTANILFGPPDLKAKEFVCKRQEKFTEFMGQEAINFRRFGHFACYALDHSRSIGFLVMEKVDGTLRSHILDMSSDYPCSDKLRALKHSSVLTRLWLKSEFSSLTKGLIGKLDEFGTVFRDIHPDNIGIQKRPEFSDSVNGFFLELIDTMRVVPLDTVHSHLKDGVVVSDTLRTAPFTPKSAGFTLAKEDDYSSFACVLIGYFLGPDWGDKDSRNPDDIRRYKAYKKMMKPRSTEQDAKDFLDMVLLDVKQSFLFAHLPLETRRKLLPLFERMLALSPGQRPTYTDIIQTIESL